MTPLIRIGLAWLAGIILAYRLNLPWQAALLPVLPAAGALWLYRRNARARLWAVLALSMCAGAFRLLFFEPVVDKDHIAFYNDSPAAVHLTGVVSAEPDVRDNYTNLRLNVESIEQDGRRRPVKGLVLVRAPRYPEWFYGDRLLVTGRLETPPVFEDFSYKDYLARAGIMSMVRRPRIERLALNQGNPFWQAMLAVKARTSQVINRILSEPHASLLNGILLGIRTGIPGPLYEEFNLTGASHIIVISGSNVSIVAGILLLLGRKVVGKRYAPPLAIAGIVVYTLLVGADAAVSRAAVMGVIWVISIWAGRPGLALNSLAASGLALTLFNPLMLWDVGFQLSFMATLGLIVLVPPLERAIFGWLRRRLRTGHVGLVMALLSELLIITLAAQLMTGPLIVYHFGRLSLVSLLTNLLILPVQPPIMILGGLAALAGLLWLPLGQLLGWAVWLPLAWTVWAVEATVRMPFASVSLGDFPFWLVVLLYAALAAVIWWANRPVETDEPAPRFRLPATGSVATRLWVGGAGVAAMLVWLAVPALPDGRLHVAFLDVGQGDAILVTTPDGRQILIDGGPSATALNWGLGRQMPFWDRSLEAVVNTHPDSDHLGGLVSLPERYRLGQVLVPDVPGNSALYREWESRLAGVNVAPVVARAGTTLNLGNGVTATVLNPGPASEGESEANNHSVVLRLQFGRVSFLLPGDIETPVERRLVQSGALLAATVLKSPHHGSSTSSAGEFLAAVNPQVVVISVGAGNRFGLPSADVLARYAENGLPVLRTDRRGAIEFITDGERLWVKTER